MSYELQEENRALWDRKEELEARIEELEAGYRRLHKYAPGAARQWIEKEAESLGVSLEQMENGKN